MTECIWLAKFGAGQDR